MQGGVPPPEGRRPRQQRLLHGGQHCHGTSEGESALRSPGRHSVCEVHQHKFTIRKAVTDTALLETRRHLDKNVLGQD